MDVDGRVHEVTRWISASYAVTVMLAVAAMAAIVPKGKGPPIQQRVVVASLPLQLQLQLQAQTPTSGFF